MHNIMKVNHNDWLTTSISAQKNMEQSSATKIGIWPLVALMFFSLIPYSSLGQSNGPLDPIKLEDNWERWQKKIPSSAISITGIQFAQTGQIGQPTLFSAIIPEQQPQYLSISIKSIDGRYIANLNYDITNLRPGLHAFKIPTKHEEKLKGYEYSKISLLATLKEELDGPIVNYLVAGWGALKTPGADVQLLIRHQRFAKLHVRGTEEGIGVLNFERLDEPTVYFNQACTIPYKRLASSEEVWVSLAKRSGPRIKYQNISIPLTH